MTYNRTQIAFGLTFGLTLFLTVLLAFLPGGTRQAFAQQAGAKQTLVIRYPNSGILLSPGSTPYRGIVYVKIFPVSPELISKSGTGPVASAELTASMRDVRQLPLGEYEVHFAVRTGGVLKTFILRNVILRADRAETLGVEMNDTSQTTIIGGDMTAQQMADTIRQLQSELAALKQQMAQMKQK